MLFIGLVVVTTLAAPVVHAKPSHTKNSPEITVSVKNITHLSLLHRIKHTLQERIERALNTHKKLKDIVKHGNVVVKFYRPDCKYCTYIDPILKAVEETAAQNVTFVHVNLNAQTTDYKKSYNLESVPTVIYFKHGKEQMRHGSEDGTITTDKIEDNIAQVFHGKRAQSAKQANCRLSKSERSCIALLISLAELHITELSAQLHAFFDTKGNKDSYGVHVEKLYQILMKIDKAIVPPLDAAIRETKNAGYKELLVLVEGLVRDLHTNLHEAHAVFKKNEGKDSLVAAAALGLLKKSADARRPQIEQKLKDLHTSLLGLDKDLANQIDALHKSLPKIFESELSNLVLLNRLKQRLSMK